MCLFKVAVEGAVAVVVVVVVVAVVVVVVVVVVVIVVVVVVVVVVVMVVVAGSSSSSSSSSISNTRLDFPRLWRLSAFPIIGNYHPLPLSSWKLDAPRANGRGPLACAAAVFGVHGSAAMRFRDRCLDTVLQGRWFTPIGAS